MTRALPVSYLLGALLVGVHAFAQAELNVPAHRHAEMEKRFQTEGELPREPSPARELAALVRAKAAVRARDAAELARAARDLVIHAEAAATGWSKAAAAWGGPVQVVACPRPRP